MKKILAGGLVLFSFASCENATKESVKVYAQGAKALASRSYSEAAQMCKVAARKDSENHTAWYCVGNAKEGQAWAKEATSDPSKKNPALESLWSEAASAYKQAASIIDDPMYFMKYGLASYKSGDSDAAKSSLEQAIKLDPKLYNAHYYLGRAYLDSEDTEKGVAALNQAIELNPEYGQPFVTLMDVYLLWDEPKSAVAVAREAKGVTDSAMVSQIAFRQGQAHEMLGEWKSAADTYPKAKHARVVNQALYKAGVAQWKLKNAKKALLYLRKAKKSGKLAPEQAGRAQSLIYEIEQTTRG